MNVKIAVEGKIRNKAAETFAAEYVKRLSPYFDMEILEVGEGGRFFGKYAKEKNRNDIFVGFDAAGKKFDSFSFASWFNEKRLSGKNLVFVIGEAAGISEKARSVISEYVSFSDMVFSYRVSLMVASEQIYRAMTIITGHPYHK